jgi:hypothetical protein
MAETWLKCSACKSEIAFGAKHWVCSVSTCNRSRTRLVFCSVVCWDSHVATLRHRDAWAVEAIAPTKEGWVKEQAEQAEADRPPDKPAPKPATPAAPPPARSKSQTAEGVAPVKAGSDLTSRHAAPPPPATTTPSPPVRRMITGDNSAEDGPELSDNFERDVLVVVSKMKKYIKDRSGMNTSDAVAELISDHVRNVCDDAIRAAARDERKTVLDRDVPRPRR